MKYVIVLLALSILAAAAAVDTWPGRCPKCDFSGKLVPCETPVTNSITGQVTLKLICPACENHYEAGTGTGFATNNTVVMQCPNPACTNQARLAPITAIKASDKHHLAHYKCEACNTKFAVEVTEKISKP